MTSDTYQWRIEFAPEFQAEFEALPESLQDELMAETRVLEVRGPAAGRPSVDTLSGSKHTNMKELRFNVGNGVWRVAFAFDPRRRAILLVAGDKSGVAQKRFYKTLVAKADERFEAHLERLKASKE